MTGAPPFTVEVDHNAYLHDGASRVDAIVTVTGSEDAAPAPGGLEIIIIDCSSSMTGEKIRSARRATVAAIAALRDGVSFTVIAGTQIAEQIYPRKGTTATADSDTRAEATKTVDRLRAYGGTGIGTWLTLARRTAQRHPAGIKHAVLLTDGQNGESAGELTAAIQACIGKFTCDCRGVGTDWRVDELRTISSALLGTVDIVAKATDLADDFRAIMNAAMDKRVADVALRLWTPRDAQVRFVKQVSPTVEDLTARRTETGALLGDYPLGSWGVESREYHVSVEVPRRSVGERMLAGRISLVRAGSDEILGKGLIQVEWTGDSALSTQINVRVAHYTGQAELAEVIRDGLTALEAGDEPLATARLGRAVTLADESGNDATARLLNRVVEVIDTATGTVRLRRNVSKEDVMTIDSRSTKTVPVRRGP